MFATGKMHDLLPTDVTVGETNIMHTITQRTATSHTISNGITQLGGNAPELSQAVVLM
jgi:hypothetical protein